MNYKPPASFQDFMDMFNPEKVARMFDPEQLKSAFDMPTAPGFDFGAMIESNRKNYEAMVAANKAATEAYKQFYEMQLRIFNEMIQAAQTGAPKFGAPGDPEAAKKQSELLGMAFEKSFELMSELASASRKANEEAFAVIKTRVDAAASEMKQWPAMKPAKK